MDAHQMKLFGSKETDHWRTPPVVYAWLEREYPGVVFFDPCPRHPVRDGLATPWEACAFVNPPYSRVEEFLRKAQEEIGAGRTRLAIFLVYAKTETGWFHEYCLGNEVVDARIVFWKGRLKFISDAGVKGPAMFGSILVVLTPRQHETTQCSYCDYRDREGVHACRESEEPHCGACCNELRRMRIMRTQED